MITSSTPSASSLMITNAEAQRVIQVTVSNNTQRTLRLQRANSYQGRFKVSPPQTIEPGKPGVFSVENIVDGQGCDYHVEYAAAVPVPNDINLDGSNPWAGNPAYSENARSPLSAFGQGGDGQHAERAVTITEYTK